MLRCLPDIHANTSCRHGCLVNYKAPPLPSKPPSPQVQGSANLQEQQVLRHRHGEFFHTLPGRLKAACSEGAISRPGPSRRQGLRSPAGGRCSPEGLVDYSRKGRALTVTAIQMNMSNTMYNLFLLMNAEHAFTGLLACMLSTARWSKHSGTNAGGVGALGRGTAGNPSVELAHREAVLAMSGMGLRVPCTVIVSLPTPPGHHLFIVEEPKAVDRGLGEGPCPGYPRPPVTHLHRPGQARNHQPAVRSGWIAVTWMFSASASHGVSRFDFASACRSAAVRREGRDQSGDGKPSSQGVWSGGRGALHAIRVADQCSSAVLQAHMRRSHGPQAADRWEAALTQIRSQLREVERDKCVWAWGLAAAQRGHGLGDCAERWKAPASRLAGPPRGSPGLGWGRRAPAWAATRSTARLALAALPFLLQRPAPSPPQLDV